MNLISGALVALLVPVAVVKAQGKGRAFVYQLTVTATNTGDVCVEPFWFGIHTGNFDVFDGSSQGTNVLSRIADGNYNTISRVFADTPETLIDGVLGSGEICPEAETVRTTAVLKVGGPRRKTRFYFSVVSSADGEAFGNEDPRENLIFRPKFQDRSFPIRVGGVRINVTAEKTKNRAKTKLSGRFFEPRVTSKLGGAVTFAIDNDRDSFAITYRIKLTRVPSLDDIVKIALEVDGEEVLDFVDDFDGEVALNDRGILDLKNGVIEEDSLPITNEQLWNEIFNDNTFVVIKTVSFPDGEVGGPLTITKPDQKGGSGGGGGGTVGSGVEEPGSGGGGGATDGEEPSPSPPDTDEPAVSPVETDAPTGVTADTIGPTVEA